MRVLSSDIIRDAVRGLLINAVCVLPPDVLIALRAAHARENGPAKTALSHILENAAASRTARRPCCQDTGLAVVFLDVGEDVFIKGSVTEAVNEGVRLAYTQAYLRKSSLSALGRENTGDNTPAILHTRYVKGDKLYLSVAPKGFGSENMSRLSMLTPAAGCEGVLDFIVETARKGAMNACPPVVLGVGVGGDMELAALIAKRQLLREIGAVNENPAAAALEAEALERVNALNIGPMGLGGHTTALAVHIGEAPTHLAGLPVAVNMQCHCARHAHAVL